MYLISSVYFLLKPYHLTRIDRVAGDIVPSLLMFDANEPESKVKNVRQFFKDVFPYNHRKYVTQLGKLPLEPFAWLVT